MGKALHAGDRVSWDTSQGQTRGKVVKKLASKTKIKGHTANASRKNPQYLVRSDKTGAKAAHKPGELRKR